MIVMREITIILVALLCAKVTAQVKGNKEIVETYIDTEAIYDVEVSIYGDISIDATANNGITIKTDSNLLDLIDTEVVDGKLKLDQKEWIQPSQRMVITIGAPDLRGVQLSTNDRLDVVNLQGESFNAMALSGTIVLKGTIDNLSIGAEIGTVDARGLKTKEVRVNIWDMGKAQFDTAELLEAKLSNEAKLEFNSRPQKVIGDIARATKKDDPDKLSDIRYIDFKIRNNSDNRHNFYVVGPKPDGRKFSYGFPMMPGAVRKENWTTGTKVYKVSGLGLKKLLVTITQDAEDSTVDLFD